MKRIMACAVLGFFALFGAVASGRQTYAQQDGAGATLTAIDKQINRLETRAAKIEVTQTAAGDESAQAVTPETETAEQTGFYGELPKLPKAKAGEVEVVQIGEDISGTVPIVIHNATDSDVQIKEVVGTARDGTGKLVAQADYTQMIPEVIPAGAYSVGTAALGFDDLPDGTTYEFEVIQGEGYGTDLALDVTEVELTDSGFVGVAANPVDRQISPSSIVGLCWDSSGIPIGYFSGFPSKNDLPAGDTTPFDGYFYELGVGLFDGASPLSACTNWVIGVTAYDF